MMSNEKQGPNSIDLFCSLSENIVAFKQMLLSSIWRHSGKNSYLGSDVWRLFSQFLSLTHPHFSHMPDGHWTLTAADLPEVLICG